MKDFCVIGRLSSSEFAGVRRWSEESGRAAFFESEAQFFESFGKKEIAGESPSLIVIAAETREQHDYQLSQRIKARFPDVRQVVVVGSWCEGETRSGRPIKDVDRIYAAEFVTRMDSERTGGPRAFDSKICGLVVSHNDCLSDSICDMIVDAGGMAMCLRADAIISARSANVVVYDAHPDRSRREHELRTLLRAYSSPVICLVDFPRGKEVEQLKVLGATEVLPKPFRNDDLMFRIAEVCGIEDVTPSIRSSSRESAA